MRYLLAAFLRMRKYLFVFLLLCSCVQVFAQQQNPRSFAVIVGITEYASKGIPALRFANRDAEAFANYLRSKEGGKVEEDNMRLLLNEKATTAAIYDALNWLLEEVRQNDVVYFYFAGHGDMESNTVFKLGFLLAYNTPRTNYINNAVRIDDLNKFATTLSVNNKAKVILITDACHSGKLAGSNFRGNVLAADQLRTAVKNEIRITSCGPDQLAMEGEAWGGGRGVFSFYLINGLIGFAAKEADAVVRLRDIRTYLDSSFANDLFLKKEKHQQNPVVAGPDQFQLSVKNNSIMTVMQQRQENVVLLMAPPIRTEDDLSAGELIDYIIKQLKSEKLDSVIDFVRLEKHPADRIAASFLTMYSSYIEKAVQDEQTLKYIQRLQKWISEDKEYQKQFNDQLVIFLHDVAQEVINKYLEGDAAELERRRYYNATSSGYDLYPVMYAVALKLTEPDDFLHHILLVNKYYFGGVALMLKIPLAKDPSTLINRAFELEQEALSLDSNAAYIHNTLGVLQLYKQQFKKAEESFLKATEGAPQWAVPWNNLMALYTAQKNFAGAADAFAKAKERSPNQSDVYGNAGLMYELQHNYLLAEEMQRKSIFLNSRHYLPFEKLANIYTLTTAYAVADSLYYEADLRKKGFNFSEKHSSFILGPNLMVLPKPLVCDFDSSNVQIADLAAWYAWGKYYFDFELYEEAIKKWKHVVTLDKEDPVIYHHLGKAYFAMKKWAEADVMFNLANRFYVSREQFKIRADSVMTLTLTPVNNECVEGTYSHAYFGLVFNHQLMASMYEQWNHFTEAEVYYRKIIAAAPTDFRYNKRFWLMLEKQGRYHDEEEARIAYRTADSLDRETGDNELYGFYRRMEQLFPDEGEWHLKAGRFLYYYLKTTTIDYSDDLKEIFPDDVVPVHVQPLQIERQSRKPAFMREVNKSMQLYYEPPINKPYSNAITSLQMADSLLALDDALSADINDKIGDLFSWQGVPLYAARHYRKSVELMPANSGVRLKLIDAEDTTYQFSDAFINLDTLKNRGELNFEKMLLLAKYYMHMSRFGEAEGLLNKAAATHLHAIPAVFGLYGRLYLLQQKPEKAISYYRQYLQLQPNDALAMYSISRMYALQGNNQQSLKWLTKAFNAGFNYSWVLKFDPLMDKLRKTAGWRSLVAKQKPKQYPPPVNSYPKASIE